ncbi:MAG: GHKL domain-containing protein [Clostridia bacterium]|nr:GHKL domain-containing protein [Clostridia bacterium]
MEFNIAAYLNCMLESIIVLLLWDLLNKTKFRWFNYLTGYIFLCVICVLVTFIDSVSYVILPINFSLILISMYGAFYKCGLKHVLLHSTFAFMSLLYIQSILLCLIPTAILGSQFGNFVVNGITMLVAVVLSCVSRRYRWAAHYERHKKAAWGFILALLIPETVIMQLFAATMVSGSSPVLIILVLLQMLYIVSLLLLFFLLYRRIERQQLKDTQKNIASLNEYLDDFRKSAHDFNKHMRHVCSVVSTQSNQPELIEAVNSYCGEVLHFSEKEELLLQLDDPALRALIYSRQIQAKTEKIEFLLNASTRRPAFPLKNYQLVEVFDNLLDNAFECVREMQKDRWVNVSLQVLPTDDGHVQYIFCVQNPYDTLDFHSLINEKQYTTKQGNHAGIGLPKVTKIVSASGGRLVLSHENSIFTAKVVYEATADTENQSM